LSGDPITPTEFLGLVERAIDRVFGLPVDIKLCAFGSRGLELATILVRNTDPSVFVFDLDLWDVVHEILVPRGFVIAVDRLDDCGEFGAQCPCRR
jgi:hypothetical protein